MVAAVHPLKGVSDLLIETERTYTAHQLGKVIYEASVNDTELFEAVSALFCILSDFQWGDDKTPDGRKRDESVKDMVAGFTYPTLMAAANRFESRVHPDDD